MSPQAPDDMRRRWPGWDTEAIEYLEMHGYRRTQDFEWIAPANHVITPREEDAVAFLILEFDWGGIADHGEDEP